jgi:predicted enzyme related to lactoylglutathione lyase
MGAAWRREEAGVGNIERRRAQLNCVCVCFLVDDVVKSAEYYRDVLGFSFERYWGEPPCFVMMERDGVQFFLSSDGAKGLMRPNRMACPDFTWDAYVNCRNGDALYEEFKAKGAEITRVPEVTFYEMEEFDVRYCNGYTICFGTNTSGESGG